MQPWSQPLLWKGAAAGSTWNSADMTSGMVLSNGGLTATWNSTANAGVRSISSRTSGKLYLEYTAGTGFLGGPNTGVGIATSAASLTVIGNTGAGGLVAFQSGSIYFNGSGSGVSVGSIADGSIISMAIDLTNQRGWFRVNGGNWNGNATYDPATNTGGVSISTLFPSNPAFALFCANRATSVTINTGGTAFSYPVPSGFIAWG